MMNKKHLANWHVALIHFLTAGFAIPVGILLIYSFLFIGTYFSDTQWFVVHLSLTLASIALGTIYSSKYVLRHYEISNTGKVVLFSIFYFVVFKFIYFTTVQGQSDGTLQSIQQLRYLMVEGLCSSIIFGFLSWKYLFKSSFQKTDS